MLDSDSQIINPLSNSNISQDDQKELIRQGVESDCELDCSQNPMLTEEENNDKSLVINKLIDHSQSSNQRVKKSAFQTQQNSQQLQSSNVYRIQVSSVDSGKQQRMSNPMYSGGEDDHYNLLKNKIENLESQIANYHQEVVSIKYELESSNLEINLLKTENQSFQQENQNLRSRLSIQETQIKQLQELLRDIEKEKSPSLFYPNKRSKTSTEISKDGVFQNKVTNNSYLTDKSISPLSQKQNPYLTNIREQDTQKPAIPRLPLYGGSQLAALLKLNCSTKQTKERSRILSKQPEDYKPPYPHKLSKSNSINLNQVKGQGLPQAFSFINSILKY